MEMTACQRKLTEQRMAFLKTSLHIPSLSQEILQYLLQIVNLQTSLFGLNPNSLFRDLLFKSVTLIIFSSVST